MLLCTGLLYVCCFGEWKQEASQKVPNLLDNLRNSRSIRHHFGLSHSLISLHTRKDRYRCGFTAS